MRLRALHPLGAEAHGVDLRTIGTEEIRSVRRAIIDHGVVAFRDQTIDDDDFCRFLRMLGPPAFTVGETPLTGHPDLNVVSNVGRTTPPRSSFHTDTSYVRKPPAFTALRAVAIPARGGATLFTDQYQAFNTLPDADRRLLTGRTVRHVATGVELGPDDESEADHPVFRSHPVTGRTALFLSTVARCRSISGLSEEVGAGTIARLLTHSTQPDRILCHRWAPGDVVLWDNAGVLHRADHDDVVGDRILHRGMVATYGPADG